MRPSAQSLGQSNSSASCANPAPDMHADQATTRSEKITAEIPEPRSWTRVIQTTVAYRQSRIGRVAWQEMHYVCRQVGEVSLEIDPLWDGLPWVSLSVLSCIAWHDGQPVWATRAHQLRGQIRYQWELLSRYSDIFTSGWESLGSFLANQTFQYSRAARPLWILKTRMFWSLPPSIAR